MKDADKSFKGTEIHRKTESLPTVVCFWCNRSTSTQKNNIKIVRSSRFDKLYSFSVAIYKQLNYILLTCQKCLSWSRYFCAMNALRSSNVMLWYAICKSQQLSLRKCQKITILIRFEKWFCHEVCNHFKSSRNFPTPFSLVASLRWKYCAIA